MQITNRLLPIAFIILLISSCSVAQNVDTGNTDMQTLLSSKRYLFTAQNAQPLSGRPVNLTSTYTLKIAGDSLVCHLPYYGQTYIVEGYPGGGGLDFVSHHFDYIVSPAKHGRYVVSIHLNDRTNVSQMYLNVSKSGYGNLQVTPTNRQTISYYGDVSQIK